MSDLSPEAEELLKRARESFSPDDARIAALRAAIGAKVGPLPPPKTPVGGAAAKVAGIGAATKLTAVVVLLGASAVGARMLVGSAHGVSPVIRMASAPLATSSFPGESPARAPPLPQATPSIAVGDLPSARPERVATGWTTPPASPLRGRGAVEKGRAVVTMPSVSVAPNPEERDARTATAAAPEPRSLENDAVAKPAVVPVASAAAPRPVDDALGEEVALLRAARRSLDGGDAAGALGLLDRYARTYPNGTMAEEALATRALTLCALGRVAAARDVVRHLEAVAPRSPQLARLRASCIGDDARSD
jgi:hypothetical protein